MFIVRWVLEHPYLWVSLWLGAVATYFSYWLIRPVYVRYRGIIVRTATWGLAMFPFTQFVRCQLDAELNPAVQQLQAAGWLLIWLAALLAAHHLTWRDNG